MKIYLLAVTGNNKTGLTTPFDLNTGLTQVLRRTKKPNLYGQLDGISQFLQISPKFP